MRLLFYVNSRLLFCIVFRQSNYHQSGEHLILPFKSSLAVITLCNRANRRCSGACANSARSRTMVSVTVFYYISFKYFFEPAHSCLQNRMCISDRISTIVIQSYRAFPKVPLYPLPPRYIFSAVWGFPYRHAA